MHRVRPSLTPLTGLFRRLRVPVLRARFLSHLPQRTHNCAALSPADAGSSVTLAGWILPERKVSKSLSFFPLRDSFGTTQLVALRDSKSDAGEDILSRLSSIPVQSAVLIQGTVRLRPTSAQRPHPTGHIEVQVAHCTLLNPADRHLPFQPSDTQNLPSEDFRAQYRYLDLRRPALSHNLRKRSRVAHVIRNALHDQDFVEVETPILLKSSPEGAREFLVPTRAPSPLFFALSQSPQQPKQLLVSSGAIDKYFQLARCFRDEDGRRDRQPEFTQVDLEMAFVSWGPSEKDESGWRIGGGEVREVVEMLMRRIWKEFEGVILPERFPVMTYHEAMARYGSDKPDTRFGLEIADMTPSLPAAIQSALETKSEIIESLVLPNPDPAIVQNPFQSEDHPGTIERVIVTEKNRSTWLATTQLLRDLHVSESDSELWTAAQHGVVNEALLSAGISPGQGGAIAIVWLARRKRTPEGGSTALGRLRTGLAQTLETSGKLPMSTSPKFLWVTEFPLFTRADEEKDALLARGRWSSSHHPFTAPMWEDVQKMYGGNIQDVRGQHYDLVLNGVEIGGGSVRVHDATMQDFIFSHILQLTDDEKASFGHLLHALRCGAPPHGGIALGFDRLMAILCKTLSIRDVIAFPKTGQGTDALFRSPAPVDRDVLHKYGLQPR